MLISKNTVIPNAAEELEKDLDITLPKDYRHFLNKYNGGVTHNTQVKLGRDWDELGRFNGVGSVGVGYSFEDMKSMGVLDNYLKNRLLPIVNNIFGDYYCISLKDEEYGVIYLVYHDRLGKKKKVASSFTEFINNTKSEPIGHIRTMEEREKRAKETGNGHLVEKLRPIWREEIEYFSNLVQEEVILDDE